MAFQIEGIDCMQYARDTTGLEKDDYDFFNEQYATTSYQDDDDRKMNPSLIVQPKGDEDIIKTIKWAVQSKVAVAIKSGGHQYSGASSTSGNNIQLDLTNTYKDMKIMQSPTPTPDSTVFVKVGVSNHLKDFIAYLRKHGLFVPTGQCAFVCTGGHGQTGGYGQLGRSFGLFGDYIRSIRMIDNKGKPQELTKENPATKELFCAVLGGSPGNFGVITHYTVEVMKASYYKGTVAGPKGIKGPVALKGMWIWNTKTLTKLLDMVAAMAAEPDCPRGFDLCISVLSTDSPVEELFPYLNMPEVMKTVAAIVKAMGLLEALGGSFPAIIVCYAQWCPTSKDDKYDQSIHDRFEKIMALNTLEEHRAVSVKMFTDQDKIPHTDQTWDMSTITGLWLFPKRREFELPYVKRTYSTNATDLNKKFTIDTESEETSWSAQVADRLDLIYNPKRSEDAKKGERVYELYNHCKMSVQIQHFGGAKSQFFNNKDNGTSYSWRDSTVVKTLDCFYYPGNDTKGTSYKEHATKYQEKNDKLFIGENGSFSKEDRRLLWGSYGDWDLNDPKIWKTYYESEEKYQHLGKVRGVADPDGTFTPNVFSVTAIRET